MSHEDSLIEFDPILTSITGDSEQGKTNIQRACELLCMNGDWPAHLVRDGQKSAAITVTFSDGAIAKRMWTPGGQILKLTDAQGNEQVFSGKKNTGEYLSAVTGFRRVVLNEQSGEEDLNFISLYAKSPLFVGNYASIQRRVSSIIGGSQLDDAKNRIGKRLRATKLSLDSVLREEHGISQSVEQLELFLNDTQDPYEKLTKLHADWQSTNQKIVQLQKCQDDFLQITNIKHQLLIYDGLNIDECNKILSVIDNLVSQICTIELLQTGLNQYKRMIEEEQGCEQLIESLTAEIHELQDSTNVCSACGREL